MNATERVKHRLTVGMVVDAESGCWVWQRALNHKGYGVIQMGDKPRPTHRVAYEMYVGEIPAGKQIDHLCRNRQCLNPDHLEPVEPRENTMRSPIAPAAVNARKDVCNAGHELAGDNLRIERYGSRRCRACARQRNAEYQARRRLIIEPGPKAARPTIEILLESA